MYIHFTKSRHLCINERSLYVPYKQPKFRSKSHIMIDATSWRTTGRRDSKKWDRAEWSRYAKAQKGEADDFVPKRHERVIRQMEYVYRSRLARRIGEGDRWMVGGLVSPGSTVRRLTSVRGFYYDVLESCGVRRNEGLLLFPRTNPLSEKSLAPSSCVPSLSVASIYARRFSRPSSWNGDAYILCVKKNLTSRANWKERSL